MLNEIKRNKFFFAAIFVIVFTGIFVRVFKTSDILNFHYDQGRDALVIWDLIKNGKFFLIGPTTGLAGVFRGPFYYYLIAPFYMLGGGNPVLPAVFLEILSMAGVGLMCFLGYQVGGKKMALISLILGSLSYEVVFASRWLSNPTPMLFLSVVLVWCLFRILDGHKKTPWLILSFVLGASFFHFGSSGELFYFPAVLIFALYFKKIPDIKTALLSSVIFFVTFLPLLAFNLKHDGILFNNLTNLVETQKSFGIPTWQFVYDRVNLVSVYMTSTVFHFPYARESLYLGIIFLLFVYYFSDLIKNDKFKVIFILVMSPLIGLIFYQGNYGNLYQYYLTGYYLLFLLGLSYLFSYLLQKQVYLKVAVVYFLFFFVSHNYTWIKNYLNSDKNDGLAIVLSTQEAAIDWIYKDALQNDFNVDVYVPPVIPYSYEYLFKWLGETKYNKFPIEPRVSLLYTIYESDPPHPERLQAWVDRQKGIGKVEKEAVFGGITVQRRLRIQY